MGKYHRTKPFTKERLTMGEGTLQRKYQLRPKLANENEYLFETRLLVLEGSERPELFILWLTKFNKKFCCNQNPLSSPSTTYY